MIWLIKVRVQRFVGWNDEYSPFSSLWHFLIPQVSIEGLLKFRPAFSPFILLLSAMLPSSPALKSVNVIFHLYLVKSVYLLVIRDSGPSLWLFTDHNHICIKGQLLHTNFVALKSELLQLLVSFLWLFPKQDFPKETVLGRTFEWLIAPYFEGCLTLYLWDSIKVKSGIITIAISEIFYLNHLHRSDLTLIYDRKRCCSVS